MQNIALNWSLERLIFVYLVVRESNSNLIGCSLNVQNHAGSPHPSILSRQHGSIILQLYWSAERTIRAFFPDPPIYLCVHFVGIHLVNVKYWLAVAEKNDVDREYVLSFWHFKCCFMILICCMNYCHILLVWLIFCVMSV